MALAAALAAVGPAQAETLGEALTGAYMTSGLIEQNRAVLRAADEDVAQSVAALRPVVTWTTTASRNYGTSRQSGIFGGLSETNTIDETFSIQLVAQATLYAGGANRLALEAAKASVLAARAGLTSVEQQVLFRGMSAFMEMRRATEDVALRQNNVRVIGEELRAARDRFEVGEVTRTDVALAEARLASAQSALAAAQGALAIATEEYRAAVGRAPVGLQPPAALPALPPAVDDAKAIALRNHPDIERAQRQVQAGDLSVRIATAALGPNVTMRGTIGRTESFQDETFSRGGTVSLNAEIPLYRGGQLASLVRSARAQADQARANLHLVRIAVEQAVGDAYSQLRVARATTEAAQAEVAAATVAFRGVREEATLGARTTLDVLDAEQELLNARARLVSAQVDETIAAYAVLSAMGRLTARDLELPVPDYDPAAYYDMVRNAPLAVSPQGRDLDRVLRALGKE
jgi:outer membrane protein